MKPVLEPSPTRFARAQDDRSVCTAKLVGHDTLGPLAGQLSGFWPGGYFGGDIRWYRGWAEEAAEHQSTQREQELDTIARLQLRFAIETGREDERYLDYVGAIADKLKQDGSLKGIAASGKNAEIAAAKKISGERAVSGCAIADRPDAAAEANQETTGVTESAPSGAEFRHGRPGQKARTDDQAAFAGSAQSDEVGQQSGVMLSVGIHFKEQGGAEMSYGVG